MLNDHLEDIALFFNKDGQQKKCWVPKDIYTDPNRRIEGFDPAWKTAGLSEAGVDAGAPYYVTNLSKLLKPGVSPDPAQPKKVAPPARGTGTQAPGQGDLVVIPYATPTSAFLVKQSDYQNPDTCPEINELEGADLAFLALTQGVVLANIPKEDITGMSCYLLNLLALNSGAIT